MIIRIFFAIASLLRNFRNTIRRIGKAPDYVIFYLEGDYSEVPVVGSNPFVRYLRPPKISLIELTEQIRTVSADPRVKGIVFYLRPLNLPLAKVDLLRSLIGELKAAGKEVVTWSYTFDTTMYYLASASDRIILQPGGAMQPMGLFKQYVYLSDALAWVGVKADFVQISPYKSAGDPLTQKQMSDEVREMENWLADSTYSEILEAVSNGRSVDLDIAKTLIDQTPCTDQVALEMGLVDALIGEEDIPKYLSKGENNVRLMHWDIAQKHLLLRPPKKPGKYVALITIDGLIVDGKNGVPPVEPPFPVPLMLDSRAGDLTIVKTLRQIQADHRAAAVVVYVNSRGGSATASEAIRHVLERVAAEKPTVVAMGPVAASGGNWVSLPGSKIFAQPNTLTGSIGVLAGKITTKALLQKLQINQEVITRGENVAIYGPDALFSKEERKRIQDYIQRIYEMFLERVIESRKLSLEALESIGIGRVWTGRQALENGLVDELGGLDEAIIHARELAGLTDQAKTRIISPGKITLPPFSGPTSWLKYAYEHLHMFSGQAICILPWIEMG